MVYKDNTGASKLFVYSKFKKPVFYTLDLIIIFFNISICLSIPTI